MLGAVSENPAKPYVLILGGAKVSDKITIVGNLLDKATTILIGGGMAYTFLKAQGKEIGKSLCDEERLDFAKDTLKKAEDMGIKVLLPVDSVVADGLDSTETAIASSDAMPADKMGLDIGPETVKNFVGALKGAKSVLWNGPMGVFENDKFAAGTRDLAKAVAEATETQGTVTVAAVTRQQQSGNSAMQAKSRTFRQAAVQAWSIARARNFRAWSRSRLINSERKL